MWFKWWVDLGWEWVSGEVPEEEIDDGGGEV